MIYQNLGYLATILSCFCVFISPFPIGSRPFEYAFIFIIIALIALLFHIISFAKLNKKSHIYWIGLPIYLSFSTTLLMLIPLPLFIREFLSPYGTNLIQIAIAKLPNEFKSQVLPVLALEPGNTAAELLICIAAIAIFIVISNRLTNKVDRKIISYCLLFATSILLISAFGHSLVGAKSIWGMYIPGDTPIFAPLVNGNHGAKIFGLFSFLCLYEANFYKKEWKIIFIILSILCGSCVYLTLSRGGILIFSLSCILLAVIFILFNKNSYNKKNFFTANTKAIAIIFACLSIAIASYIAHEVILNEMLSLSQKDKVQGNFEVMKPALGITKLYWSFGVGAGGVAAAYYNNFTNSTEVSPAHYDTIAIENFTNNIAQLFVEYGVIFAIIFVVINLLIFYILLSKYLARNSIILVVALFFVFTADLFDFGMKISSIYWLVTFILALLVKAFVGNKKSFLRLSRTQSILLIIFLSITTYTFYDWAATRNLSKNRDELFYKISNKQNYSIESNIARHPLSAHNYYLLSRENRLNKKYYEAIHWAGVALKIRPIHAISHLEKARSFTSLNKKTKALAAYKEAWLANKNLGNKILIEVKRFTQSFADWQKLLPKKNDYYYSILCAHIAHQRPYTRLQCFDYLVKLAPDNNFYKSQAILHALTLPSIQHALIRLNKIDFEKNLDGKIQVTKLKVIEKIKGFDVAFDLSQKFLQKTSNPIPILLWQLNQSQRHKNYQQALKVFTKLKNKNYYTSSKKMLSTEIRLLYLSGQKSKALNILRRLNRIYPSNTNFLIQKANLEIELHLYDSANKTYKEAALIAPNNTHVINLGNRIKKILESKKRNKFLFKF